MPPPLLGFDADQQTSAVDKETPQNDRWRTEQITPHRAPPFTLLAVADGEGPGRPGEMAGLALDVAFAEARSRRDEPLPDLLKHVLQQMNSVICHRGSGDTVGTTLAAVQENQVWVAQAGSQTRCYRVRGRRQAVPLGTDNDLPLGQRSSIPMELPAPRRLMLGDKLVLCTDGLFAGNLVSPADIARIDRYDDIKGAARHLSALAMGRNVRDNVTVLVASYGRSRHLPIRRLVYELLAAAVAILIILILSRILASFGIVPPRPPDLGVAVLADGAAQEFDPFGVINPETELNVLQSGPVHLIVKRRESLESAITRTIHGVDLYFGPGAHLSLAALDVEGFTDPRVGLKDPVSLTEVALYSGRALILSRSSQTFYLWLGPSQDPKVPLLILQGEDAALGVDLRDGRASASCLRGSCSIWLGRRFIWLVWSSKDFEAGTRISIETGGSASLDSITTGPIPAQDLGGWFELCSASEPGLETLPAACRALMP